ncbi:unnamed protein product [Allacma fusca]|uniref:Uncharacterized protein n=1 Tax=Allacma fusca TaxID=39272 RepID=A0A8J2LUN9_9HEXA|nr:unnamed protein product [Allacma fusca]
MNAFLAELVEYVEKISTTIQSGFGGSRAAPKLNTKDGYESPWNYGNWDSGDDSTKQVGKKGTTGTRVGSPPKNIFNEALSSLVTRISQAVSLSNAYGGAGR